MMLAAIIIFATIDINIGTSYNEQHEISHKKCCQIGDASLPYKGKQQFSFASQFFCHCANSRDAG